MTTTLEEHSTPSQDKLPIGIQDFKTIREQGYIYVDKTRDIYSLVTQGMFYFLSRPRRFGKSLLVSTLKYLFQGKQALFEGLWIAEHGEWDWEEHPVILLDFSEIDSETTENLRVALEAHLKMQAQDYGITLTSPLLNLQFTEFIHQLFQKTGKQVVILIDEYDKALIDHLGQGNDGVEIAKANRALLKRFFGVLKGGSIASALRLVFLTGISRFSKISIFSELNNLADLSMHPAYAGLLGYTQEELERCFAGYIQDFEEKFTWPRELVLEKLARQYNGYRFSENEQRVYNPFSILRAFSEKRWGHFWFQTGTPTFLINLLKRANYNLPEIEGLQVGQAIFDNYDLERLSPEALMFQTGYLTITDLKNYVYTLDYPNQEVKSAFTESLLFALTENAAARISSHVLQLAEFLRTEDFDAFFESIHAIFAAIPYDIETKRDEGYFHTLFYLVMTAAGVDARSSILTCRGRIDLAIIFPDSVYIIEFKCNQSAEAAIRQIYEKAYAEPYRRSGVKVVPIGINFSTEQKNITEWKVERY